MRMMMFVMLAVILGANFYVFYRLWHLIPAGNVLHPVLVVFGIAAVSSMFISVLLSGKLPSSVVSFLYTLGTSWFFIMFYLLLVFVLMDLVRLTHLLPMHKVMFGNWMTLGVLAAAFIVIFTAGYLHYRKKDRVELTIQTDIDRPLKVVALSDLHLGYSIGKKEFSRWVELINAEKPDIVLIAGDMIDNNIRPLIEQDMGAVFKEIKSTYGVFAVPGNHEYIAGLSAPIAFLEEAGMTVLRDSAALVDGRFYVVGRDDRSNPKRKSIAQLTDTLDRSRPIILLDHQPYHLEEAEANGIALQISGHTHHGQIWPFSLVTDKLYEVSHGYLKKGDTNIYVSSGIGIWGGKFRIGTRSEYLVIHLDPRSIR